MSFSDGDELDGYRDKRGGGGGGGRGRDGKADGGGAAIGFLPPPV